MITIVEPKEEVDKLIDFSANDMDREKINELTDYFIRDYKEFIDLCL